MATTIRSAQVIGRTVGVPARRGREIGSREAKVLRRKSLRREAEERSQATMDRKKVHKLSKLLRGEVLGLNGMDEYSLKKIIHVII